MSRKISRRRNSGSPCPRLRGHVFIIRIPAPSVIPPLSVIPAPAGIHFSEHPEFQLCHPQPRLPAPRLPGPAPRTAAWSAAAVWVPCLRLRGHVLPLYPRRLTHTSPRCFLVPVYRGKIGGSNTKHYRQHQFPLPLSFPPTPSFRAQRVEKSQSCVISLSVGWGFAPRAA